MQPRQQPMPSKTKSWSIKLVHVHREFKNYISLFISVISLILFCKQLYLFQLEKWHFAHYYFFLIEFQFPYKALLFPKKKRKGTKTMSTGAESILLICNNVWCACILSCQLFIYLFFLSFYFIYTMHT